MYSGVNTVNQSPRQKNVQKALERKVQKAAVQKSKALFSVFLAGVLALLLVVMAAFSADLNRKNNEIQKENEYLQAEIDSFQNEIGSASNINKIEQTATEELGMIHPESQNCVSIGDEKNKNTDLASTIKNEAYN